MPLPLIIGAAIAGVTGVGAAAVGGKKMMNAHNTSWDENLVLWQMLYWIGLFMTFTKLIYIVLTKLRIFQ